MERYSFLKNAATLISGNVWAQLISLLSYFVLTRIFTPEDFGLYNIFFSYIEILIILSTCKFELSIVVAKTDRQAAVLARLALRLNAIVSAVILTAIIFIHYVFHRIPLSVGLLIPPMVFFCGTTRVYTFIFNRYSQFKQIAISEVATSTTGFLAKLALAFSSLLHFIGLPLGTVLGKAAGNINYLLRLRKLPQYQQAKSESVTNSEMRQAALSSKNFPLYVMPKDFLNSFSNNLPFIWLALYFDDALVGIFSLALTFTFRPVNILNNAFEKLLYVRTSERVKSRLPIGADIRKFILILNAIAFPIAVIGFFFAEPIFTLCFGAKWAGIGYYVRCLLPWVYIMLTSTSLMFISNVFSTQRTEFFFCVAQFILRAASVLVGILTGNFQLSILLFALSGALTAITLLIWYLSQVRRYDNSLSVN